MYVNDLQRALGNVHVQLYADDTVIYVTGKNAQSLTTRLQLNLNRLSKWCKGNKLTLNPSKTKQMVYGTRQAIKNARINPLVLDGKVIQSVPTFKYLGFTLDSTLTYKAHINDVTKKVLHKRTLLAKIKPFLTKDAAIKIYKMMILPYFGYCDVIYQTTNANELDKLQRIQNKCLKTCLQVHRLAGTEDIHRSTKCCLLAPRRNANLCNFMFLRRLKGHNIDDRAIDTRLHDAPLFRVDVPNKDTFKRSVLYSGSKT